MAGIPSGALTCVDITVFPQELCIIMPGGVEVCVQIPDAGFPQPIEIVKQLLAQFNAALTPLSPLFNIIDMALTIVKCIKSIPDGPTELPPFKTLVNCIPDLIKKASKVAAIIPPLSLPFTILGVIDAILVMLEGFVLFLQQLVAELEKIAQAAVRAEFLSGLGLSGSLSLIVTCSQADATAQMANFSEGLRPVNLLLGLINQFLPLVGLSPIPAIGDIGVHPGNAIQPLADFVLELKRIRQMIPV